MTRADDYATSIHWLLSSGRTEEVVRAFYSRMPQSVDVPRITNITFDRSTGYLITFTWPDGETAVYRWQNGRWRNGKPIADAAVYEMAFQPRAYFEGMLAAAESILNNNEDGKLFQEREQKISDQVERLYAIRNLVDVAKSDFRLAINAQPALMKACARKYLRQRKIRAKHTMPERVIAGQLSDGMPPVPVQSIAPWSHVIAIERPVTGIYFAFCGESCEYVGKSVNIPSRLKAHNKVHDDHGVCFIEMPEQDIHFAELYYIWLLRPKLNHEGIETQRAIEN